MRRPLNGFTLIELMVIIAILASLSVVAMPIYQNYLSTSAATTYVGEFAEFKHAYQTEAVIDRREICDEEYLKQLNFDAEPISALFRSRMTHNAQDGILVEVTAALNQESLAGLRAATMVHDHFAGQNALVGTPLVTSSLVHFQAAMVPCGRSISGGITQAPPGTAVPNPGGGSGGGSVNQPAKPNQPAPVSCALPEIEFQGQCVTPTSCQQGGAYDPADPTRCQSCGPTHDLIGDQCLAKCGPDEVRNGSNQCVTPANCYGGQFATGDPTQCGSCGPTHDLIGDQCLAKCSADEVRNGSNQCVTPTNCYGGQFATGDPTQCGSCGPTHDLIGDQCLAKCSADEVRNGSNQCVTPTNCHGGQFATGDPTQCGSCGPTHDLIGDQCLAKCSPDEVRNGSNQCVTPANCQGGQYNANNPVQCLTCGSGYGLNSAKACVKLANCHSGSRSASSPDQCTRCGNGFTLQGDQCICPSTKVTSTAGQCMAPANCQGGQYNPNNPAQCLTCGSGYGLNSAKACVKEANCQGGSFVVGDPTQCSTCGPGSTKVGSQCLTVADDCALAKSQCGGNPPSPGHGNPDRPFWQCVQGVLHHNHGGWKEVRAICK